MFLSPGISNSSLSLRVELAPVRKFEIETLHFCRISAGDMIMLAVFRRSGIRAHDKDFS